MLVLWVCKMNGSLLGSAKIGDYFNLPKTNAQNPFFRDFERLFLKRIKRQLIPNFFPEKIHKPHFQPKARIRERVFWFFLIDRVAHGYKLRV